MAHNRARFFQPGHPQLISKRQFLKDVWELLTGRTWLRGEDPHTQVDPQNIFNLKIAFLPRSFWSLGDNYHVSPREKAEVMARLDSLGEVDLERQYQSVKWWIRQIDLAARAGRHPDVQVLYIDIIRKLETMEQLFAKRNYDFQPVVSNDPGYRLPRPANFHNQL